MAPPGDGFLREQFEEVEENRKRKCKHCDHGWKAYNPARERVHLTKCTGFRNSVEPSVFASVVSSWGLIDQKTIANNFGKRYRVNDEPSTPSSVGPVAAEAVVVPSVVSELESSSFTSLHQTSMSSFADRKLTAAERDKLNYTLSKGIHMSHYSLAPFQNRYIQDFIKTLRPGYSAAGGLPSREDVGGKYLLKHKMEVMGGVLDPLRGL